MVQGGQEVQSVFIEDTAHCADMSSRRVVKRDSLRRARQVSAPVCGGANLQEASD